MKAEDPKALERLLAGVARVERPTDDDWTSAEADLGVKLPQDFIALVSALGTGWIGVGLSFRNPAAR